MAHQSVVTNDITDPYSRIDAWMYDTFFAPAVLEMVEPELLRFTAALPPDAKVADIGCGGGHIPLSILGAREDVHLTGIDLSASQVARAKKRTAAFQDHTVFEVASALDLPFESERFDAVLSITCIKHWPVPHEGLAECIRVLKPGGRLLVIEVDRGCRLETVRTLMSHSKVPGFLRGLALPLLRTFILGQGLDLDEFRGLLASLPLSDGRVARIEGRPGIVMTAQRTPRESEGGEA